MYPLHDLGHISDSNLISFLKNDVQSSREKTQMVIQNEDRQEMHAVEHGCCLVG